MRTNISFRNLAHATILSLISLTGSAQKKVEITFEDLKTRCDSAPPAQRVIVAVTRFNVTTTNNPPELGDNMATMLESALHDMNCFRVIESLSNMPDMTQELNGAGDGYMNKASMAQKGKMLGAQAVITGEVTEYNEGESSIGIGLVKTGRSTVRLGFVLKVLNPETRDILWSRSVNVEGKKGGSFGLGFGVPLVGRLNFASSMKNNPALMDALEKGTLQACKLLADDLPTIDLPEPMDPELRMTVFNVANIDYGAVGGFEALIKAAKNVSKTSHEFGNGAGQVVAFHKGSSQDLLDALYAKLEKSYVVTGMNDGHVDLRRK